MFVSISFSGWSQSYIWQGGIDNQWSTIGNWVYRDEYDVESAAVTSPSNTDNVVFATGAAVTIDDDVDNSLGTITSADALIFNGTFKAGALTIDSGGLTVAGDFSATGDVELTSGDFNCSSNVITSSSFKVSDGSINIAGTFNYSDDVYAKEDINVNGAVTAGACDIEADGNIYFLNSYVGTNPSNIVCGKDLIVGTGGAQFRGNITAYSIEVRADSSVLGGTNTVTTTEEQLYKGEILVNNDVIFTGSKITFEKTVDSHNDVNGAKNITVNGNAEFLGKVGNTRAIRYLSVSGTTVIGDSIKTEQDMAFSGTVTVNNNSAVFTCASGAKCYFNGGFAADTYLNLSGEAEVYGNNSFASVVIDNSLLASATTVNFEGGKWQTIASISVSGNSLINNLTLGSTSSGKWYAVFSSVPDESDFSYAVIDNSSSVLTSGSTEKKSLNLVPSDVTLHDSNISSPTTSGWFTQVYYWLGLADSSWTNAANWAYDASGTNMALSYPLISGGSDSVVVQAGTATDSVPFVLILAQNINMDSITVENGAVFDLNTNNVTASTFENDGTVRMSGTQTISATMSNGADSRVEYYGTLITTLPWDGGTAGGKQYNNLYITGSVSTTNVLDISGNVEIDSTGDITLNGANVFGGNLIVTNAEDVIINSNADGVTLATGSVNCSTIDFKNKVNFSGNTVFDTTSSTFEGEINGNGFDATINSNAIFGGNVFDVANLFVAGTSRIGADISTTGKQTYTDSVVISAASTLTSLSSDSDALYFASSLNPASAVALTINGNVTFDGDVGAVTAFSTLSVSGKTVLNSTNVRTRSNQTYTGSVSIATSEDVVFQSNSLTNSLVWFKDTLTGNGGSLNINLSKAQFDSTVSGFSALEVAGACTVNASSITTTANQTYTGAFVFNSALELTAGSGSSLIIFGSNVTGYEDLTLTGIVSVTGSAHTFTLTDSATPSAYKTVYFDYGFDGLAALRLYANARIKNDNTFSILNVSALSFPAQILFEDGKTQTVSSSLVLSGTETSSLTLNSIFGASVFNIGLSSTSVSYTVSYVEMGNCYNSTLNGSVPYYLAATSSSDDGNNWYWNLPGVEYTWTGGAAGNENDWFTKENWTPSSVPGLGSVVTIPAGRTEYPILDLTNSFGLTQVSVGNTSGFAGAITVEENALLDLAKISVTASTFTNNGTVRLFGTTSAVTQTINASMANGENSVVEYYGGTAAVPVTSLAWDGGTASGKQYVSLTIKGDVETSETVKVGKSLLINTDDPSYNVKLTATANEFAPSSGSVTLTGANDVELYSSTVFSLDASAECSSLLIRNTQSVTLQGDVTTSDAQTYKCPLVAGNDLTLSAASVEFSSGASQSISGSGKKINLAVPDVNVLNSLSISPSVLLSEDVTVNVNGAYILSFNDKVDSQSINHSLVIAGSSSTTVFGADVGNSLELSSLEIEGKTTISCASVKTTASQTYRSAVNVTQDSTLTGGNSDLIYFGSTLTGSTNDLALENSSVEFISNVSGFADLTVDGQVLFNASGNQSVTTQNNQTYKSPVEINSILTITANDGNEATEETVVMHGISSGSGSLVLTASIAELYTADYITNGSQKYICKNGVRVLGDLSGKTWQATSSVSGVSDIYITDCPLFLDFGSNSFSLNADLTAGDIYFYSGTLTVQNSKTIRAAKESNGNGNIALWGTSYSSVDPRYSDSNSRFAYYGYENLVYKAASSFGASLSASLVNITAEGNFYANGLDLQNIVLTVKDNSTSNPIFNSTSSVTQNQWGLPYAVAFNSSISGVTVNSESGSAYLTAGSGNTQNCTDGLSNVNVQFEIPYIDKAYTVFDDVIYVHFNIPLENSNNEISENIALYSNGELAKGGVWYSSSTVSSGWYFTGAYKDADCTTAISESDGDIQDFYLRAQSTWNTDATGVSPYNSALKAGVDSTDRNGNKKNLKADINFLEGLFTAADGHTMCRNYGINLENSATAASYTQTEDHAAPVLIALYTGQELHTTGKSTVQTPYDAHNFIELRYSEAVDIGGLLNDGGDQNIRADSSFSASGEWGGEILASGTGLEIQGYAKIESGEVNASSKTDLLSPHSLYRKFATTAGSSESNQSHRIRIGVASYVDGTVTFNDSKNTSLSGTYHNWIGYITKAVSPSGSVVCVQNDFIKDLAEDSLGARLENILDYTGTSNHPLPSLAVKTSADEDSDGIDDENVLYGSWDVLPPLICPFITKHTEWSSWGSGSNLTYHEIIGSADSTSDSYLEHIELHLLDNDRSQSSAWTPWWRTKLGWNDSPLSTDPILPDTKGGSRPFATDSSITSGGIRLSSLIGENSHFSYKSIIDGIISEETMIDSATQVSQKVYNNIFRAASNSDTTTDGLYLRLPISENSLPVRTTFNLFYDPSGSYITDLAGNLLSNSYSSKTEFTSIDLTPPALTMTLSPVANNQVYVIFTKELAYQISEGETEYLSSLDSSLLAQAMEEIKDSFVIIPAGSGAGTTTSSIEIQKVEYVSSSAEYTALRFTLERDITLSDIENLWIRDIGHDSDIVTDASGFEVSNTKICDYIGNYLTVNSGHAVSDFAVNAVDVLFAVANKLDGEGSQIADDDWNEKGVYGQGVASSSEDYAVHDFSSSQGNYGKLVSGRDITLQVRLNSGTEDVAPTENFVLIPSKKSALKQSMISDKINNLLDVNWRLWLPSALNSLATDANSSVITSPADPVTADSGDGFLWNYSFPYEDYKFSAGEEIQFVFKVQNGGTDITIDHDADSWISPSPTENVPLYAVSMPLSRIKAGDFSFIDLWSFGIKDLKHQRGGVTILNNVINVNIKEQTVIEVNQAEEGSLNIYIMTLDGNIIKKLAHGKTSAGTHYYRWNGTNNAGKAVARGMYFVRVTGPGIDETRKVLCIKE